MITTPPMPVHRSATPRRVLWRALAACGIGLLTACGGGGGGGGDEREEIEGATGRLYIGWYEEDPTSNPEDPTVGALAFRVPDGAGSFQGLMPFSYTGCAAGVDVGAISGQRNGNTLDGRWTGSLDGITVGGSYTGSFDAATASFGGSFANTAGKQPIVVPPCNYFMAPQGRFRVYDGLASEPAGVALSFGNRSTAPTIGWSGLPAGALVALRLFDEACLEADPGADRCFVGEGFGNGNRLAYPAAFAGAQALAVGRSYIVVLTAQTQTTGTGAGLAGFASARFTPTEAAAPAGGGGGAGGGAGGGGGASLGQLTLTGMPSATRFVPAADGFIGPTTSGPTCMGTAPAVICGSSWLTSWVEPGATAGSLHAVLTVSIGTADHGAPGPVPGSRVDQLSVQLSDLRGSTIYHYTCGGAVACARATHGVEIDLGARTLRFRNAPLTALAPNTGAVMLDGTLGF